MARRHPPVISACSDWRILTANASRKTCDRTNIYREENMRSMNLRRGLAAAFALMLSTFATAQVRVSEIHYDNVGADTGEAIEVSGPAGADVTGWTVVLYNGSNGGNVVYDTKTLSGVIPATCGARGVAGLEYPANGLQNGGSTVAGTPDPDGVAPG